MIYIVLKHSKTKCHSTSVQKYETLPCMYYVWTFVFYPCLQMFFIKFWEYYQPTSGL